MHGVKQLMYRSKESKAPTLGEPDILRVGMSFQALFSKHLEIQERVDQASRN